MEIKGFIKKVSDKFFLIMNDSKASQEDSTWQDEEEIGILGGGIATVQESEMGEVDVVSEQKFNPVGCDSIAWAATQVEFFIMVDIPIGYVLNDRDKYKLTLVADGHLVKLLPIPQLKLATVHVEDELGNPVDLNCICTVIQMKLAGSVVYNFSLEGFQAQAPLTEVNEPIFQQVNTVFIEKILGYSCCECGGEDSPLAQYQVTLTESDEVMVIVPGQMVVVEEGSDEFFNLISTGDVKRTLGKKYIFTIAGRN